MGKSNECCNSKSLGTELGMRQLTSQMRKLYIGKLFLWTSAFVLLGIMGALALEQAFDQSADTLFEHLSRGVSLSYEGVAFRA
uniref:Uncharacterized protein n=1 Tax=Anolis carolinensis TaxID=28377 RepID=A0A803SV60_ANOCA